MPDPCCTKSDFTGEVIGNACPDCGHTNVLHPGRHNPALNECLVCVLIETKEH